jgi:response regulator NasT
MRILVANERASELEALTRAAESLGAEVVAGEVRVEEVARVASEEAVDVAVVGLPAGATTEHALALIDQLAREGVCPVVAINEAGDDEFVAEAAELGVYAHATRPDPEQLRGAIDVAVRRFQEHTQLEVRLDRKTYVERAKGILMERYGLDEHAAFVMLRRQARNANLTLVAAAQRILDGHRLLPSDRS